MALEYGDQTYWAVKITDNAGTNKIYIEPKEINLGGQKLDKIRHLAARISFITPLGEQKQIISLVGRLLLTPGNNDARNIKDLLELWMDDGILPLKLYVTDFNSVILRWRDSDKDANFANHPTFLLGYVMRYNIKMVQKKYTITLTYEECES